MHGLDGVKVLKSMNERQIGYLNELYDDVVDTLIGHPEVLSKINDEQFAHLKQFGRNGREAYDYIMGLEEDIGHKNASGFFSKIWNWIVG